MKTQQEHAQDLADNARQVAEGMYATTDAQLAEMRVGRATFDRARVDLTMAAQRVDDAPDDAALLAALKALHRAARYAHKAGGAGGWNLAIDSLELARELGCEW